jgi:hypothetical protein
LTCGVLQMMSENVVKEPDQIRAELMAAHRKCMPTWPAPTKALPLPWSSATTPNQQAVDHTKCFAVLPMIPPVRHRLGMLPRSHGDGEFSRPFSLVLMTIIFLMDIFFLDLMAIS